MPYDHLLSSIPPNPPTDPLAVAMILAGVAILAIIFMLSARHKLMQRRAEPSEARKQYDRLRRISSAPVEDADVANARMHQRAQQLAAVLDNKAAALEQLIAEADERIARLQAAQPNPQSTPRRPAKESAPQAAPPRQTPVEAPPPPAESSVEAKPVPTSAQSSPVPVKTLDPTTESVYRLADAGLTPVEIAQKMDEQIGKVELILALRPRAAAT